MVVSGYGDRRFLLIILMENDIYNFLNVINDFSALGVAALSLIVLLVYIKLNRKHSDIKKNDLSHIESDLKEIRDDINCLQINVSKQGERLSWLEAKIDK